MKNSSYTNGDVKHLFFKYALPSVFGMLIVAIQMMVDGMFVGRNVGVLGLAAVNLSMPFLEFILSVSLMIIVGGVVVTGIAKGGGDEKLSRGYASLTLLLYGVTISLISIVGALNFDAIASFLGVTEELYPYVRSYLLTMMVLAPFLWIPNFTEAFARLEGRPNLVFVSGFICFAVNVILDYIFIVRLGWGLRGAAFATCIANSSGALALSPFVRLGALRGSFKVVRNIYFNGSSEMLISISAAFSTYLFNLMLMKHVGSIGVAALTIVFYINMVVNMSLFGLSQALHPIVSFNLGAANIANIRRVLKVALFTGGAIGFLAFVAMICFKSSIITIFAKGDMRLLEITKSAATLITIQYLFSFINIIASSFHTAIEKPLHSALIALCRSLIFVSALLYTLPKIFGLTGIWMTPPLAELLTLCVSVPLFLASIRRLMRR